MSKVVLPSIVLSVALSFSACSKQQDSSDLNAVNPVLDKGTLVFSGDNSDMDAIFEDAMLDYKVFSDGTVHYDGFASFFGKKETQYGSLYDWDNGWQPFMYMATKIGRSLNSLLQINFAQKVSFSADRDFFRSDFFKTADQDKTYLTSHDARIEILDYDRDDQTAKVVVYPKSNDEGYTLSTLDFYDAKIKMDLDLSDKIVKILNVTATGEIQGKRVKLKMEKE